MYAAKDYTATIIVVHVAAALKNYQAVLTMMNVVYEYALKLLPTNAVPSKLIQLIHLLNIVTMMTAVLKNVIMFKMKEDVAYLYHMMQHAYNNKRQKPKMSDGSDVEDDAIHKLSKIH